MMEEKLSDEEKMSDDESLSLTAMSSYSYTSQSGIKPRFEAMLKEIEEKLPSLDDDDSDFEDFSGDEMEIFQRPSTYSQLVVEDADKDLDESLTSSDLSDRWSWKPVYAEQREENIDHSNRIEHEEENMDYSGRLNDLESWLNDPNQESLERSSSDLESLMSGIRLSTVTSPREAWPDENTRSSLETPSPPPSPSTFPLSSFRNLRPHTRSPRTRSSRQPRSSRRASARTSAETKLSLGSLENVDFDVALQFVVEEEYQTHQRSRSSSRDLFDLKPGDNSLLSRGPNKCAELMQNLANLSVKTTGERLDIDPISGASRGDSRLRTRQGRVLNKYEADMVGEKGEASKNSVSMGMSTSSQSTASCKVLAARHPSERMGQKTPNSDRGTIYMDLRMSEQALADERHRQEVVQRVLKLNDNQSSSTDSSSDSNSEEDRDSWFEQRRRVRQALQKGEPAPATRGDIKPKAIHREVVPPPHPIAMVSPAKRVSCGVSTQSADSTSLECTAAAHAAEESQPSEEDKPIKVNEDKEVKREIETFKQKAAHAKKIIDAKLAICNKLLDQRPTRSLDKKRAAAPGTFVMYHMTTAHELPLISLPANAYERNDILVLTVNLSSNEEMTQRSQSTTAMEKIDVWSGSYKALIGWFCSLVPHDIDEVEPDFTHLYPFHVVGLQQMVIDGKLLLAVAVAGAGLVEGKILQAMRMNIKAYKKDERSLFAQYVQKFLSLTNLAEVSPWLDESSSSPVKPDIQYTYTAPHIQITHKPMSTFVQVQTNPESLKQYFGADIGFYWQTVHNEEQCYYSDDDLPKLAHDEAMETTIVLISRALYSTAMPVVSIFTQMYTDGFEIAGIRLARLPAMQPGDDDHDTLLAVAIRGTGAVVRWLQRMGPADPELAREVDKGCLMAQFGGPDKANTTLFTPRTLPAVSEHLCRWFGGRLSSDNDELTSGKVLAQLEKTLAQSSSESCDGLGRAGPTALLSATTTSDCFVVISAIFPVKFIAFIFGIARSRGFCIRGARRRHLNQKQISALGISSEFARFYAPTPDASRCSRKQFDSADIFIGGEEQCYCHHCVPRPVTIMHLSKENASHHGVMMLEAGVMHVLLRGLLEVCAEEKTVGPLVRSSFLHFAPFSASLLAILGREFAKVPEADSPASTSYIPPRLYSNSELEQISLIVFVGNRILSLAFSDLCYLQGPEPDLDEVTEISKEDGLELLGIKWLPSLNTLQAREITPYEVGQPDWKKSIKTLTGNSALIVLFRGINCANRIKDIVYHKEKGVNCKMPSIEVIVTNTPELTYRLATLFFFDRELFADFESRPNKKYLPPMRTAAKLAYDSWEEDSTTTKLKKQRSNKGGKSSPRTPPISALPREDESIFKTMLMGPRPLVTLLIIKPGLIARNKLSRIFLHVMHEKFCVVGLRLQTLTQLEAICLQSKVIRQDDELSERYVQHMTSGPCLLIALKRENAIKKLEDILGPDDPAEAKAASPFFLRGCYGTDIIDNGLYCSTSYHRAVADIKKYFPDGVCCSDLVDLKAEDIAAPCVDSVISVKSRIAKERSSLSPGRYNLNRLNEVNCLVLLPPLVRREANSSKLTDILQCLQAAEAQIVGARMVWLVEEQAQQYLHVVKAGSFAQVPVLTNAPIIVLAIQCQNVIISFNYMMQEAMRKISKEIPDYKRFIMTAKDTDMAKRMCAFFFDQLIGDDCRLEIVSKCEEGTSKASKK